LTAAELLYPCSRHLSAPSPSYRAPCCPLNAS